MDVKKRIGKKLEAQCRQIMQLCEGRDRILVGIAGSPAVGKSTFAEHLDTALRAQGVRSDVVPMDGFHLDNTVLEARGIKHRKGAPDTFDADGFIALVQRLRYPRNRVFVPLFDRQRDLSLNCARLVKSDTQVVLMEGNYLLLQEEPWAQLADLFDHTIMLSEPMEVLRQRLIQRWLDHGLSKEQAHLKAEENDLPNARKVQESSRAAVVEISASEEEVLR